MKAARHPILLLAICALALWATCAPSVPTSVVPPPPDEQTDDPSQDPTEDPGENPGENPGETPGETPGENPPEPPVVNIPVDGLALQTLQEISGDIINPERGFYQPNHFRASSNPLSVSQVKSNRAEGRSLFYIQFRLDQCMSSDIPQAFLDKMQTTFDALREGGAKCILRYCYKESDKESSKPWDAEEEWVMRHIEQIKPLLQKNEDVIMVFQAGFVGVWGEWAYTDHFIMNPSKPEHFLPRRRVLEAMLAALPESRQVAVRTPDFKMKMYGLQYADTLTAATGHSGSLLSRIGGFNDCFMSSANDWGTYANSNSRTFWRGDTRYTFMGGETCAVQQDGRGNDYCNCQASIRDMEHYHWTYLNIDYNTKVLDKWKSGGCYNEVKRRLGYRLVVDSLRYTPTPVAGEPYRLVLYMRNAGFSAPQNPRGARLIFVTESGEETAFELGSDPRSWHPGITGIDTEFILPAAKGSLYLQLPDPLLPDRPEYCIALANQGVWNKDNGYNKLLDIE